MMFASARDGLGAVLPDCMLARQMLTLSHHSCIR